MTGQVSGGQKLTPNRNVEAPAGIYGDQWGANGGGATPVQGPPTIKQTLSNGQTAADYVFDTNNRVVLGGLARGVVAGITADSTADNSTTDTWTADEQSPGVADSQI